MYVCMYVCMYVYICKLHIQTRNTQVNIPNEISLSIEIRMCNLIHEHQKKVRMEMVQSIRSPTQLCYTVFISERESFNRRDLYSVHVQHKQIVYLHAYIHVLHV